MSRHQRGIRPASCSLALLLFALSGATHAQTLPQEYGNLIRAGSNVGALDAGLLGERIDYYTGHVDFIATDVSLPGNNALPVAIGRRYAVDANPSGVVPERAFGDWDMEVPHIEGIVATSVGWTVPGANPDARCSAFAGAPAAVVTTPSIQHAGQSVTTSIPWEQYAIGYRLAVPGQGRRELLKRAPANNQQPTSGSYPIVTNDWWMIGCVAQLDPASPGTGEGFLALSPDGTKYTFNWLATRAHVPLSRPADTNEPDITATLDRSDAWMMATKVEDRFGNWVKYQYDPYEPLQLDKITSSDGRTITIAYNGATNIVHTVDDGSHVWTYGYAYNGAYYTLTSVTQPDGSKWQIDFEPLNHISWTYADPWTCGSPGTPIVPNNLVGSITHPTGAKGTFTFNVARRGRTGAPAGCYTSSGGVDFGSVQPTVFDTLALTKKTITGPRLPAALNWSLTYAGCSGNSCAATVSTTVTDPRTYNTRYTFGTGYDGDEGLLTKKESGGTGATYLASEAYQYVPATGQSWPADLGTPTQSRGDAVRLTELRPLKQRTTTLQGVSFGYTASNLDSFGFAQGIVRAGSDTKSETVTYAHNKTKWVLGTVKKIVSGGTTEFEAALDALNEPTSISRFGEVDATFGYNGDGTLQWSKDGDGHKTSYANWYRGIPKNVTYATGESASVAVSNVGAITQWTDERGAITGYDRDAMGRLAGIHYPSGDAGTGGNQTFAPTIIAWSNSASGWISTETTDTYQKTTQYDALLRPTLVNENNARYVNRSYDGDAGVAFESLPSTIANDVDGTHYTHDGLGRVTQKNFVGYITNYAYQSGFVTKVSDPNATTYYGYLTHDAPSTAWPVTIDGPLYTTSILRDDWGRPYNISRTGSNVVRKWNWGGRFVCSTYSPERGTTVLERDGAGNVTISADVAGDTGCNVGAVNATNKVIRTYDNRNRLLTVDYPGGSDADIVQTWWPNGLLHTTDRGGIGRTYNYNRRGLLTFEQLVADGDTYEIDTAYNTRGQPSALTYPDATSIDYAPDAWGGPTKIGSFASGITYWPNGAVKGFSYGNGIVHAMTEDIRELPQHVSDVAVIDTDYGYDGVGNVTAITDHLGAHVDTVAMTYDGANRLATANAAGLWGNGIFSYDVTDALKGSTIGGVATTFTIDAVTNRASATVTSGVTTPLGYDTQGHLTQKGAQTFTFNRADLLTDIPGVAHYRYDADGKRAVTEGNGVTQVSIYDTAGRLLMDVEPGLAPGCATASERIFCSSFEKPAAHLAATRYVYLGRHLIGKDGTDGLRYLHTDALGSLLAETNASKAVTARYHYQPYGRPVGAAPVGPGYAGHVMDASGLTYMQARYYDPQLGRFLSTDPVEPDTMTGANFNRYAYAGNNPYSKYDPDGRWVCSGTDGDCDAFEGGLNSVEDASMSSSPTDQEQDVLGTVVDFYGDKGDDAVTVFVSSESGPVRGSAAVRGDGGEDVSLRIDDPANVLARNIVHEGQHGIDDQNRGRDILTRGERKTTEINAYAAQATLQKAMNFATSSSDGWTPFGGYSFENINRQAESSVATACRGMTTGSCGDP